MTSTTFFRKPGGFFQSYRAALRQIRGIALLYTAILAVVLPLLMTLTVTQARSNFSYYSSEMPMEYYLSSQASSFLYSILSLFVLPLLWLFALIFTVSLFRYLHDKRSVDLFHSLPIRRETMLFGRLTAELTALVVPLLAMLIVCFAILLCFGIPMQAVQDGMLDPGQLWLRTLFLIVNVFALIGLMIFFLICCGTVFDAAVSTIAFCGGLPLLLALSLSYLGSALPGFCGSDLPRFVYEGMNPLIGAFSLANEPVVPWLLWWLGYGAVLLIAAVLLYRRRASETAENAFAFPLPRVWIRFLVSACFGMCLGLLIHGIYSSFPFLLGALLGAFLSHLAIEMVYRRGVKNIWKTMPSLGVVAGLFVVFYLICATGCFGYTSRIPAVEDVKSVTFTTSFGQTHSASFFTGTPQSRSYYGMMEPIVTQKENVEQIVALHQDIIDSYHAMGPLYPMSEGSIFEVSYELKDGSKLRRRFYSSAFPEGFPQELDRISLLPEVIENTTDCFFLTQDSFDTVSFWNSKENDEYQSFTPNAEQRSALIEALQQDFLTGMPQSSQYDERWFEMTLSYQGDFSLPAFAAEDSLAASLFHFDPNASLYLDSGSYLISSQHYPNTTALLEQYGWIE